MIDSTKVFRSKACGGDRAKNLQSIADRLQSLSLSDMNDRERHELRGLAEQLKIIAAELDISRKTAGR